MNPVLWLRIIMKILELIAEGMSKAAAIQVVASLFDVSVDGIRRRFN